MTPPTWTHHATGPAGDGARGVKQALANPGGWARRDVAISLLLLLPTAVLFPAASRPAMLGVFGLFFMSALLHSLVLLAVRRWWPLQGWLPAWIFLAFSVVFSFALLWWPYAWWTRHLGQTGLSGVQCLVCISGFALLAFGLPMLNARRLARILQLAELQQQAMGAELKALQAQVEPHFLFNTLANARYLARQDPPRAVQMLDHLIAYLHSALPDMRRSQSTLGRECELAQHYLALMGIRFGERLSYRVYCEPELAWQPLPPLLLMTLVENAIKHGVEPQPGAVLVEVEARRSGGRLLVSVRDNGAGLREQVLGRGIGLRNMRERLATLYGGEAGFSLRTDEQGRTEAMLQLPAAQVEEPQQPAPSLIPVID